MFYIALIICLLVLDVRAAIRLYISERLWIRKTLRAVWDYVRDWRTFVSFFIAWMITNGWCYVFIALGTWLHIRWMRITGWSYLAFLWMPFTPEKIVTIPLGAGIKKILFGRKK